MSSDLNPPEESFSHNQASFGNQLCKYALSALHAVMFLFALTDCIHCHAVCCLHNCHFRCPVSCSCPDNTAALQAASLRSVQVIVVDASSRQQSLPNQVPVNMLLLPFFTCTRNFQQDTQCADASMISAYPRDVMSFTQVCCPLYHMAQQLCNSAVVTGNLTENARLQYVITGCYYKPAARLDLLQELPTIPACTADDKLCLIRLQLA